MNPLKRAREFVSAAVSVEEVQDVNGEGRVQTRKLRVKVTLHRYISIKWR